MTISFFFNINKILNDDGDSMAGHSQWKNIQHRKGAQDKKKGKIFTKIIREITVSVREGGVDPSCNPRLRSALVNARSQNMPKDNIERAIKKGSGAEGDGYIEVNFEAYGPDGVAIYIECATDNNTRTVSNIRSYFNKYGGSLGKEGCLQFVFEKKGVFTLNSAGHNIDELTLELIDVGAEDVEQDSDLINVTCAMENFGAIQKKLHELGIEPQEAGLQMLPLNTKEVSKETYLKVMKLIDVIEDDDDVQKVHHNIQFNQSLVD